jgi:MSHA biogenesis protein MshK
MAQRLIVLMGLLAAVAGATWAQALSDPTRPPAGSGPAAATPDAPASVKGEPKPAPRLQSVLIAPGRRLAVIDGSTVALGGKIDDAVVVGIAETHVTLRRGAALEVLPLYPGIERKPVKSADKGPTR